MSYGSRSLLLYTVHQNNNAPQQTPLVDPTPTETQAQSTDTDIQLTHINAERH